MSKLGFFLFASLLMSSCGSLPKTAGDSDAGKPPPFRIEASSPVPWFIQTDIDGEVSRYKGDEINRLLESPEMLLKSRSLGVNCRLTFRREKNTASERMWLDCEQEGVVASSNPIWCASSSSDKTLPLADKRLSFFGKRGGRGRINVWIFCGKLPTVASNGVLIAPNVD